jgi:16S rRNA (cytosine967-C5)-methyltransferase
MKQPKKMSNTRAIACLFLTEIVEQGKSFTPHALKNYPKLSERDKSFIIYLCFGVLRFYPRLQEWSTKCLNKPLKAKDLDLQLLMMIGLFQLFYTDIPHYAALNETVAGAQSLGKPWARGLINHVLHEALRKDQTLPQDNSFVARTAHPLWLANALKKAWPSDWEDIMEANLTHAPFALRVNQAKITREGYLTMLTEKNLAATIIEENSHGIILTDPINVDELPGFAQGLVSVQDGAAQLAAELMDLKPQQRILDACAAPGGKMAHILEKEPNIAELVAVEKDFERMTLLENTLKRLNLSATLIHQDVCVFADHYQGEKFDRILLDAPCSATGVIRRHPDIKLHRTPEDIRDIVVLQAELLQKIWPLLKENGLLVYATCCILPEENTQQIAKFLSIQNDAKEVLISKDWGIAQQHGRQILPGQKNMDGFYYAILQKV